MNRYTDKEIETALHMRGGSRRVSFRYDLLNRYDIKIGELDGITGSVSYGEFRSIKRSATFELDEYLQRNIDFMSDQIQPFFILHMPDGGTVEWPLGIFLLESPAREISGRIKKRSIGAYDKTIIIKEDKFTERHFIAAGSSYVAAVEKILSTAGIVKMDITPCDIALAADKEFPVGTVKKDAINELLESINYNSIRVDELGSFKAEPYIPPDLRPVTQVYSSDRDSILHPQFSESLDIAGRANVFTRVAVNLEAQTELVSTYVNDSVLSPISTVNRGRRIVDYEEIENIATKEVLDNFVKRIAIENTSAYSHLTFETALMPTHGSMDTLYLNIPEVFAAPAKFSETSWEMDLKYDGVMKHEARKVVQL